MKWATKDKRGAIVLGLGLLVLSLVFASVHAREFPKRGEFPVRVEGAYVPGEVIVAFKGASS